MSEWETVGSAPDGWETVPPKRKNTLAENIIGGIVEPIAAMGTGFAARPISQVVGLGALASKMLPEGMSYGGDPQALQQNIQHALTFEPETEGGRSPNNPLNFIPQAIGKGVAAAGHWAGEGIQNAPGINLLPQPVREGLGRGVTEAVEQAPGLIGGKAGPAVGEATGAALQGQGIFGARGMMQRALKPSIELQKTGKAADAITTMLDEGIDVSRGGLKDLNKKIDTLDEIVKDAIANSPATVDKFSVSMRLMDTFEKFKNAVGNEADIATIRKTWNDFLNRADLPGDRIPVQKAQAMKQATYQKLKNADYGELKGAEKEALKDVARGLREEIVNAVPEVKGPLAMESQYLNVLNPLEQRVMSEANRNPGGLGLLNPKYLLGWMAATSAYAKSKAAHGLNKGGQAARAAGETGPYIGMASAEQAQEEEARKRLIELLSMGQ